MPRRSIPNQDHVELRINEMEPKLNQVKPRCYQVKPRRNQVERRLNRVEPRLDQVVPRLNQVEPGLNQAEPRCHQVEPILRWNRDPTRWNRGFQDPAKELICSSAVDVIDSLFVLFCMLVNQRCFHGHDCFFSRVSLVNYLQSNRDGYASCHASHGISYAISVDTCQATRLQFTDLLVDILERAYPIKKFLY